MKETLCPKCGKSECVIIKATGKESITNNFYHLYACLECPHEWTDTPSTEERQNWL
jgi:hypothetical protein